MRDVVRIFGPFVFLGGVGLLLGAGVGFAVRRWRLVAALVLIGLVATLGGLSMIEDDPDEDDDPGLALAITALTNLAGWTLGLVGGAAIARYRARP